MTGKLYTVAEANALLPYLAPTLVELREKFELAERARESVARAAAGNGWSEKRDRWSTTMARVAELMERLEEWELQLRDVSTGLVDFPAVVDGQEAYLCWRLGEPEVAYYHGREEGFGGRRRL
ncbi:MAG TPA: DUF2203 domain-containing protein [Actinomycetota bacterium]|nr:DUF2203 domain-containing protein [Actinomycetota bacterium]